MNKNLKKALTLGCAMLITTGAFSVNAANLTKTVKAVYNNIKVTYDGQSKAPQYEPFMIDGTVYVSLRDAGQMTNNNVGWDGINKTVQITSKTPQSSISEAELASKNLEIATLKNQVTNLEKKVAYYEQLEEEKKEEEASKPALDAKGLAKMEDVLIDKYGDEFKVDWDFSLDYSDKKEILTLTVTYDSDYDKKYFPSSSSKLEGFLEDLCEEIRANYEDIAIEGELYDSFTRETRNTFTYSTKNKFSVSTYLTEEELLDIADDMQYEWAKLPNFSEGVFKSPDQVVITDIELKAEDGNETIIGEIYTDLVSDDKDNWNIFVNNMSRADRSLFNNMAREMASYIKKYTNASTVDLFFYTDNEKMIAKYQDGTFSVLTIGR